jgi:hypothetical protein
MEKRHPFKSLLIVVFMLCLPNITHAQCPTLVWSDEFNGTEVDVTKWTFETGTGCDISLCGWGNNELQYYQAKNATISNGILKGTTTQLNYSLTGLVKGYTNTADLTAIEAAGNESTKATLVVKTNRTGLKLDSTVKVVVDPPQDVTLYPNPVKDILNVKYLPKEATIEIFDINGRMMGEYFLPENESSINLSALANGTYTMRINSGGTVTSLKILKI